MDGGWAQMTGSVTEDDLPEGVVYAFTTCPHCERSIAHHAHPSGGQPTEDDVTICWYCGAVLRFLFGPLGTVTGLAPLSAQELAAALTEPDVKEALAARAESYTTMQALQLRRAGGRFG